MSLSKDVLEALEARLKVLAETAEPDQLAYLAKALESVAGKTTAFDLVQLTDEKLKELLALTESSLTQLQQAKESASAELQSQKEEAEAALTREKDTILTQLENDILQHLSLLETKTHDHVSTIQLAKEELTEQVKSEMARFDEINDLPEGKTLMQAIQERTMIEPGALPLVFGILSRNEDYYGLGGFTTELGKWASSGADTMMGLLCGSHTYTTDYTAFFRPPQLCFLQGEKGVFMVKHMNIVFGANATQYQYPHACLGVLFVKNTTDEAITSTLSFGGACGGTSGYKGMALYVGAPKVLSEEEEATLGLEWSNLFSTTTASSSKSSTASVTVPANTTVAILLYTSGYYVTTSSYHYAIFSHWFMHSVRSDFLKEGLEIDIEKTLKAWQCPGYANPYELWTSEEA